MLNTCLELENRLLSRFDAASQRRELSTMAECAKILSQVSKFQLFLNINYPHVLFVAYYNCFVMVVTRHGFYWKFRENRETITRSVFPAHADSQELTNVGYFVCLVILCLVCSFLDFVLISLKYISVTQCSLRESFCLIYLYLKQHP